MSDEFKPGDVVELKSGGPPMTIQEPAPTGSKWICVWFDGATRMIDVFATETLKKHVGPGAPRNIPFSR